MLEVFTTNIQDQIQSDRVLNTLQNKFPLLKINFDLDDSENATPFCHSILRVEGATINPEKIISVVIQSGFMCNILEDKICK